jgi:hypothetical protein
VHSRGRWIVMVFGVSPDSSRISTSPRVDYEELEVAIANLEQLLAGLVPPERRQGQRSSAPMWASSSLGKAIACKS